MTGGLAPCATAILQGGGVERIVSIEPKLPIINTPRIIVDSETVRITVLACPRGTGSLPKMGTSSGSREVGFSLYLTMKYVIRPKTMTATRTARYVKSQKRSSN